MTEAGNIARREQYIESALERIADLEADRDRLRARMAHYADWIDGLYMSLPTDRPPGPPKQLLKEMRADIDGQLRRDGKA